MTDIQTKFQEFIQDAGRHRIFEQESLSIEATELISTLMKERQISKAELAKRIGKSKAFITQLLSGGRNMTLHTFADLAFALGYKVDLHASPLSKSSEVLVFRNEIHLRTMFHRKVVRGWADGIPGPSDGGVYFGDMAPAA
jgi:transcriptional regulator with XRE-family HTH domain